MKKSEKFYFIVILLSIPLIIYLVLFSNDRRSQYTELETDGILDTAVIVREFTGAKRRLYLSIFSMLAKISTMVSYSIHQVMEQFKLEIHV